MKRCKLISIMTALVLCFAASGCMASVETELLTDSKPDAEEDFSIAEIQPGDDFYGWCNAAELMDMHIPENERSVGSFSDVQTLVDEQLELLIRDVADSDEDFAKGTDEQLIHDLYHLAYDTCTGEKDTTDFDEKLARDVFDRIQSVDSIPALLQLWEKLGADYAIYPAFSPSASPDLYDSSVNTLYLRQIYGVGDLERAVENVFFGSDLRDNVKDILSGTGIPKDEAKERATQVTYMLLDIGSVTEFYSDDDENLKDMDECWFPYAQSELEGKLRHIDSQKLLRVLGLEGYDGQIVLENEAQFFMIESLLDEAHLQAWKDYTLCCFVQQYSLSLPPSCGGVLSDGYVKPEDYAVQAVEYAMSMELGELYAQRYFSEDVQQDIVRMCEDIKDEYRALISGADWLTDAGKQALCSKLDNMPCYVGADAPHEPEAKDAAQIGRSLLETEIRVNVLSYASELAEIGKPAVRNGFAMMAPQTVNACYDPQSNCFNITAAILNPPFYDPDADDAANLGAIGAVIGHEISHAFDDNGMKYDASGRFAPDWMPQADRDAFKEMQERTIDYYSQFKVLDTYAVKGRLTLGENLADISGVQCALAIAGTPDKQKLVFESYANVWKELSLDSDAKDQISMDVHSPGPVRVNAVVACFDEFYEIYDVQEGDKLYVAPADRIRRW